MKIISDLSISSAPHRAGHGWHPDWLFRNGARGAVYDPSDLSALWQDTGATQPAAPDQPVARLDDLSGNGYHMVQSTPGARPVLRTTPHGAALEFDGVDHLMSAITPPSAWAWAHQDAGVTIGVAAEVSHRTDALEFIVGTMTGSSSSQIGISLNSDNRDIVENPRNARVQIARGVAGQIAGGFIVHSGASAIKVWTFVTQPGSLRLAGRGFMAQSGWMNLPTATADPSLTLFMGGASTLRLSGRIHGAILLDRAVGAADELRLRRWLEQRSGVEG